MQSSSSSSSVNSSIFDSFFSNLANYKFFVKGLNVNPDVILAVFSIYKFTIYGSIISFKLPGNLRGYPNKALASNKIFK